MRRFLHDNSLSITMLGLFAFSLLGQFLTGFAEYRQELAAHGTLAVGRGEYLLSGHFLEAVFENWESEFLQMGTYVVLTAYLYQRGSPESRRLDAHEPQDENPASHAGDPGAPWPVRRGGLVLRLYERSLGLALMILFALSFALHAYHGAREHSRELLLHGEQPVSALRYVGTTRFWFESFQNWQSEFLSIGILVVLSIFLRQKGSPESKPVAAPHSVTGGD